MLDVRRLETLRELAARGTIAATAEALGCSPPAVSQQLAALEHQLGVRLLERAGRTRRLTTAGRQLVAASEAIFRGIEAAEATVAASRRHVSGVLRCAAFATGLRGLVIPAAGPLRHRHPQLLLSLQEIEQEESLPALRRRVVDVALVQDYPFAPWTAVPGVERRPVCDDPILVALAAETAPSGRVRLADLAGERWVAGQEGAWCHRMFVHAARTCGFEPEIAHRTNDYAVALDLVRAEIAVALVPSLAGPPPLGVRLCEIEDLELSRRIFVAMRAGGGGVPAVEAFVAALVEQAGQARPASVVGA